jgi:type IV secretion system protein VirB9
LLAACATQAPQPTAAPPVVAQAPKHHPRHIITAAEILAAQPADVQQIIANHQQGERWPTVRHGSTVLYPFDADASPVIAAAPLRTTDIQLEPGETITDVALGDAQRWMAVPASAGDPSNPSPHLVVKPELPGLDTNLTIYTTRRIYHLDLHGHGKGMQEVEFYYPQEILQQLAAADRAAKQQATETDDETNDTKSALPVVDPAHLNFAYKIDGAHVAWTPTRAFDDGTRVYLQMPARMQTASAPALMLDDNGGKQMVNYRVVPTGQSGDYYVVDRLFDKAELISGVGRDQDRVLVIYAGAAR